ncbi:MAG: tyrosine-type recombinase/integrase [Planctomycetota bacterium]
MERRIGPIQTYLDLFKDRPPAHTAHTRPLPPSAEQFLAYREAAGASPATLRTYRFALASFPGDINAYTWRDIDRWNIAHLSWAKRTRTTYAHALSAYYEWAMEEGLRRNNPVHDLPPKRRPRTPGPRPKALPWEQVERLLAVEKISNRPVTLAERAMVHVLALTGMRLSEACALRVEDIDLDRGEIHIRQSKNGDERTVPIVPQLAPVLRTYAHTLPSHAHTIFGHRRKPKMWGYRVVLRIAAAAGVKHCTPHVLRHSLATHMINSGSDSALVQALLGHSSVTTTISYYCKVRPEAVGAALTGCLGE